MSDLIPRDMRLQMEEVGIKFDEDGNIIEEDVISEEDIISDDDQNDDDDDQNDDQDDNDDDEDQDDDDEDDDEPLSLKLTKRHKSEPVKKESEDIIARLSELINKDKTELQKPELEDDPSIAALKREVAEFRRMRMKDFAKTVEKDVDNLSLGASFQDIIVSEEWGSYLDSKLLGSKVGNLYAEAIRENDGNAVVSFFKDFTDRYLSEINGTKKVSNSVKKAAKPKSGKPNLDDLAVPNRSKSVRKPKRSKYDFEENDYAKKLEDFERGKLTHAAFVKFENDFSKALTANRVKASS